MKIFFNKITKNKKTIFIVVLPFIIFGIFGGVKLCSAFWDVSLEGIAEGAVISLLGWLVSIQNLAMGAIISLVIKTLISIAQYNNFIYEPSIVTAWQIIRDFCNMFFILVLLVIAFATILRVENYNVKKLLPKLLLMAILINFSRTICGLIIDAAQVIMLTFVNAFSGAGGGGEWINTLGVDKYLTIVKDKRWTGELNLASTTMGMILAFVFLVIAMVVLIVLLCVLVMRIIMLWIYVVLSPFAFLLSVFPAGQKYASQWWDEFIKEVVTGPVLAFFIWLALISANSVSETALVGDEACFGPIQILCPGSFVNFVVAIGMLLGGLVITEKAGGAAGNIASKGSDWAKKLSVGGTIGAAAYGGNWLARKFSLATGIEIRPAKIIGGIKSSLADKARKEDLTIRSKAAEALRKGGAWNLAKGTLGASDDAFDTMANGFLWHKAWFGKKGQLYQSYKYGQKRRKIEGTEQEEKDMKELEDKRLKLAENPEKNKDEIAKIDKEIAKRQEKKRKAEEQDNATKARISTLETLREQLAKDPEKNEDKIKQIDEDIRKAQDKLTYKIKDIVGAQARYKVPYTFNVDMERKAATREQIVKIGDDDNEDNLVAMFSDAVESGDKERAGAVFLVAGKVGHSNEILEQIKAKKDYVDGRGKTIKAGENFVADADGLNNFVQQYLIGELEMSQQEAFGYQSQFSTLAKAANHFNLAESVGVENGRYVQRDRVTQMSRAVGEIMKMDSERAVRSLNRLGVGGEIQYIDENGEIARKMDVNEMTEREMAALGATWYEEAVKRKRMNPNLAKNFYLNYKLKVNEELAGIPESERKHDHRTILDVVKNFEGIKFKNSSGDDTTYDEVAWQILEYGRGKFEAENAGKKIAKKMLAGRQATDFTPEERAQEDRDKEIEEIIRTELAKCIKAKTKPKSTA